MDSSDDESSVRSQDAGDASGIVDSAFNANEIEEDLTADRLLSPRSSSASLKLDDGTPNIKPRAYQIEMFEESLKRNTIVAMDTGSGKTHVAVLRMLHELERMPVDQFIWFLAPTVALCSQQFDYISSQITTVQVKFLSGADEVDRWTEQSLWDALLQNVKVVVSTYQILLDALTHGFVKIHSLALIVFDEAHNCLGKHPGAKIMQSFYHPRQAQGLPVPCILGLTASPVMRADPMSLSKIEETLHALCRTPNQHRAELRLRVNLPVLSHKFHRAPPAAVTLTGYTRTIRSLGKVFNDLKIEEDPYVLELQKDTSERGLHKYRKVVMNHKTWSQKQMKTFHATSLKIAAELGAWAADYYISEVVTNFAKSVDRDGTWAWDTTRAEKLYLAKALSAVEINRTTDITPASFPLISDKVNELIKCLPQESLGFAGIIFVQERAVVTVLTELLKRHPSSRPHFRVGSIVGSSGPAQRPNTIGELIDARSQKQILSLFKDGTLNLIVATSVLEEGIDVPVCNFVLCFQKPTNLKSFVQRRGRARHKESKLILLLEATAIDKLTDWQQAELEMKALYEDEMRSLQKVLAIEDAESHDNREYRVEATGAFLDLDNAVSHLFHFCATLPHREFVDLRPDFICFDDGPSCGGNRVRARATLPLSVNESVRTAEGKNSWLSEKNAMRDAAFEAYIALHKAKLVNDNLLPLHAQDAAVEQLKGSEMETRPNLLTVNEQMNPWIHIARCWRSSDVTWRSTILLDDLKMSLYLPIPLPVVAPFQLYWDSKTQCSITIDPHSFAVTRTEVTKAVGDSFSILEASFGSRFPIQQQQHVVLFSPSDQISLKHWMNDTEGRILNQPMSLIRDKSKNILYIFREQLSIKPSKHEVQHPYEGYDDVSIDTPHLSLTRLSRRLDFLHKIPPANELRSAKRFSTVLPTSKCIADDRPFKYIQFGFYIPSIMRRLEIFLLADMLSTTMLRNVEIRNIDLIVNAISASSANEEGNYQRLEFIGDSILKLCTSVQLAAEYPTWHEGYLSKKKDMLVSNARLSRAAVETGLDRFIITKSFTGNKWRPSYVDELVERSEISREMSTKVLADVVEALVGAAMTDGGIDKAMACLRVFLPELDWQPLERRQMSLYQGAPDIELPVTLLPLETLIGYKFRKNALLVEAMTHASCNTGTGSLERLEFLGDSILDRLVVNALEGNKELSHIEMHLFRTALVNADFLAFLCMEWGVEQTLTDIRKMSGGDESNGPTFSAETETISVPLWKFMRHHSPKIGAVQIETAARHASLRKDINMTLRNGTHYPWALLARLSALKFYSDLVESLLGAIWIDSGSFDVCLDVIERMGILPYLRRILRDGVHLWHPKEELGQLAVTKTVKYTVGTVQASMDSIERKYWCKVSVGDEQIVEFNDGLNSDEAKTKAAELAVMFLKARKEERIIMDTIMT